MIPLSLLLSVCVLWSPAAIVDDDDATTIDAVPDDGVPTLAINLTDALLMAIERNTTVQGAQLDAQSALEGYGEAWGAFDSVFFTDVNLGRGKRAPTVNVVGGVGVGASGATDYLNLNYTTGFRGTLLTGTTWQFDINVGERYVASPGFRSDVFSGNSNLSVTHPLLRGGGDYARQALELAQRTVFITTAAAADLGRETLEAIVTAYWNLYFAYRDVETKAESVALAQELVDITTRKFDQGLQTRIDQVEAEAELAQRLEEQLTASNTLEDANDELLKLITAPGQISEWNRRIIPSTEPKEEPGVTPAVNDVVETALRRRPDIIEARLRVAQADTEVARADRQTLPRLDVTAGIGTNSNDKDFGNTTEGLRHRTFYDESLVLNFELPIGNRAAGYALRRLKVARDRAGVTLRETEMNVIQEVRSAVRGVQLQEQRVIATSESTRLNRELYEGERRRLQNDLSTPFQVRETLQNLLAAIDTETRARLDREVARTRLLSVQGLLLQHYGIAVPEPPRLDESERPPAP